MGQAGAGEVAPAYQTGRSSTRSSPFPQLGHKLSLSQCHLCFTEDGVQGQWRLSFLLLLPPTL